MSELNEYLDRMTEVIVGDFEKGRIIDEFKSHAQPDKKKEQRSYRKHSF